MPTHFHTAAIPFQSLSKNGMNKHDKTDPSTQLAPPPSHTSHAPLAFPSREPFAPSPTSSPRKQHIASPAPQAHAHSSPDSPVAAARPAPPYSPLLSPHPLGHSQSNATLSQPVRRVRNHAREERQPLLRRPIIWHRLQHHHRIQFPRKLHHDSLSRRTKRLAFPICHPRGKLSLFLRLGKQHVQKNLPRVHSRDSAALTGGAHGAQGIDSET